MHAPIKVERFIEQEMFQSMHQGFIKVAAGTPDIRVADVAYNAHSIITMMNRAAQAGVKLLVLPELCLTGYTCGDLFMHDTLLIGARDALESIAADTRALDMLAIIGLPLEVGGNIYDCAAAVYHGHVLAFIPKANLSEYGELYEKRQFSSAPDGRNYVDLNGGLTPFGHNIILRCAELPDFALGIELCEDLFAIGTPSTGLAASGATIICNLSASNEIVGRAEYRRTLIKARSASLVSGYIYANAGSGESTSDLVFAGHNLIAENGSLLAESRPFENGLTISEIDVNRLAFERRRRHISGTVSEYYSIAFSMHLDTTLITRPVSAHPFIPDDAAELDRRCEFILNIQASGLARRIEHVRARTAVVGISGGLDSSLALMVAVRAMDILKRPHSDVISITMPCFGTTRRTKSNAERLAELVGATLRSIDITEAVRRHFADIGQDEACLDVTYENSQARERTQVLMDTANRTGGLVIGTGDLSELALGWATYNGDHMSMYGVNASVPKTLIRHIIHYCAMQAGAGELRSTLLDILDTPVSPELLPAQNGEISQVTEDLVGPYELHDFFLYYIMRWGCPPKKVVRLAEHAFKGRYDRAVILKWLRTFYRRFFQQQFKRSCLPDGPKVGSVCLSPRGDWRMPSDACAALWLRELERME